MILKRMFKKGMMGHALELDWFDTGLGEVFGASEWSNKPACSVKYGNYFTG
jgi:hypothetical protein